MYPLAQHPYLHQPMYNPYLPKVAFEMPSMSELATNPYVVGGLGGAGLLVLPGCMITSAKAGDRLMRSLHLRLSLWMVLLLIPLSRLLIGHRKRFAVSLKSITVLQVYTQMLGVQRLVLPGLCSRKVTRQMRLRRHCCHFNLLVL